MKSEVISIAAIGSKSRALGKDGDLIWKIPADLKRFKELTSGHPIIMGSKTYHSLPKRPLPNRTNIVLTRAAPNQGFNVDSSLKFVSYPEEALKVAENSQGGEKIYIIGGGEIYKLMLPYTDTLELTIIEEGVSTDADVFFPEYENKFTKITLEESDEHNQLKYSFVTLSRR